MPSVANKVGINVLFREWDPESWEFGPIIEVKIDKQCYSNKLAQYLSEKVYTGIPTESI